MPNGKKTNKGWGDYPTPGAPWHLPGTTTKGTYPAPPKPPEPPIPPIPIGYPGVPPAWWQPKPETGWSAFWGRLQSDWPGGETWEERQQRLREEAWQQNFEKQAQEADKIPTWDTPFYLGSAEAVQQGFALKAAKDYVDAWNAYAMGEAEHPGFFTPSRGTIPPEWQELLNQIYQQTGQAYYRPSGVTIEDRKATLPDAKVNIPHEGWWDTMTPNEKEEWLNTNALERVWVDENGFIVPESEMERLMSVNPGMPVREYWLLGRNVEAPGDEVPLPISEALDIIREGRLQKWHAEAEEGAKDLRERSQLFYEEYNKVKQEILDSELDYWDKVNKLMGLYQEKVTEAHDEDLLDAMYKMYGLSGGPKTWAELGAEVFESLTEEEKEEIVGMGQETAMKIAKMAEWKASGSRLPFDEWLNPQPELEPEVESTAITREELQPLVEQYGITVLDGSPWISPIPPSLVRKIPIEVLRKMADYLASKNVSWGDFLAMWGGGGSAGTGRWNIPRQW